MLDIENLLVKVSWYYFMEDMTQQQIAELLNIPRMRVVKLLSQAKKDGIVQFKIKQAVVDKIGLERRVKERYSLNDVVVIPRVKPDRIKDSLGKAAALYIDEKAKDDDFINIGFGDTVSKTVSELIYQTEKNYSFVSLTGGVSYYTSSIIEGAHYRPSSKTNPKIYVIPAPLLGSTKEVGEIFRQEPSTRDIFSMNALASMSVVGIGAMDEDATLFRSNIANPHDFQILTIKGAVGDLLSFFFDSEGRPIESEFHQRLISTSIENLRNYSNTIAVAGGGKKHEAIKAALKGGYIDVLITDEETAEFLVSS